MHNFLILQYCYPLKRYTTTCTLEYLQRFGRNRVCQGSGEDIGGNKISIDGVYTFRYSKRAWTTFLSKAVYPKGGREVTWLLEDEHCPRHSVHSEGIQCTEMSRCYCPGLLITNGCFDWFHFHVLPFCLLPPSWDPSAFFALSRETFNLIIIIIIIV